MNANEVLDRVVTQYRGFHTYSDQGTVTGGCGEGLFYISFATEFCRPDKYSFEWNTHSLKKNGPRSRKNRVISQGGEHKSIYDGKEEMCETRGLMLAGAYGVTQTAVSAIYSLLLGDDFGVNFVWYQLPDAHFADCETIFHRDCYVISGSPATQMQITICVDKENYLVRELRDTFFQDEDSKAEDIALFQSADHIERLKEAGLSEKDIERLLHWIKSEPPRSFTSIIQYKQIDAAS